MAVLVAERLLGVGICLCLPSAVVMRLLSSRHDPLASELTARAAPVEASRSGLDNVQQVPRDLSRAPDTFSLGFV
ncbi:hypothetical protein GGR56DRAFT_634765 [Xylariaceae sp. FL0804]|nr:hypothetical protein GGR56DRAFT_634765 [Xylariaceae sp. FL0804]